MIQLFSCVAGSRPSSQRKNGKSVKEHKGIEKNNENKKESCRNDNINGNYESALEILNRCNLIHELEILEELKK